MRYNKTVLIIIATAVSLVGYGCYHVYDFSRAVFDTIRLTKDGAIECRVTEFTHRVDRGPRYGLNTNTKIEFEYEFRGSTYRQSSNHTGIWGNPQSAIERATRAHRSGDATNCTIDVQNPAKAVFEIDTSFYVIFFRLLKIVLIFSLPAFLVWKWWTIRLIKAG